MKESEYIRVKLIKSKKNSPSSLMIGARDSGDFHNYLYYSYIYPDERTIEHLVNRMKNINYEFSVFGSNLSPS